MKTFKFDKEEIKALKSMAYWRAKDKVNIMSDFPRTLGDSDATFEAHYLGVVGEFAVAKQLNGFFDCMPKIRGDKHKSDVIVGSDGKIRISVKTTKYSPPILKVNHMKEIQDCTHLALCHYAEPELTIYWVKSKEFFLKNKFSKDFGYGPRMCLGAL